MWNSPAWLGRRRATKGIRHFRRLAIGLYPLVVVFMSVAVAGMQADRISAPITNANLTRLQGSVHPLTRTAVDAGRANGSTKMERMKLIFQLTAAQQKELDALLAQQQDSSSPNYHKWLTPEKYADRFGLSKTDIAKAAAWLQSQGFSIAEIAQGRTYIAFNGTARQVEGAFRLEIHSYLVNGEWHYSNATEPFIPAALAGVVSGVSSLHNFSPKPRLVSPKPRVTSSVTGNHFIQPGDFATIYDLTGLYNSGIDGTGQTIAVAGQTDLVTDTSGNFSDIVAFRQNSGLSTPPNLKTKLVSSDPGIMTADIDEASLDVEWSGGIAKNANIVFVIGNPTTGGGAFDALQYAVSNNLAPVISISYGLCEPQLDSVTQSALTSSGQQANAQGQTIVAPSGDGGAADCDSGASATSGLAVDFPASMPYATAAGGSEFSADSANSSSPCAQTQYWSGGQCTVQDTSVTALSYIPETAWNDTANDNALTSGGGGLSVLFTQPAWQTGLTAITNGMRGVPDISLSASADHDGYLICSQGSCTCGFRNSCTVNSNTTQGSFDAIGGTSASAPAFAAIVALINQQAGVPQGNVNRALYSVAASTPGAFHDITTGSNIVPCTAGTTDCPTTAPLQFGYSAGPGYDLATGLGSVDAGALVAAWGPVSTVTLSVATVGNGLGTVTSSDNNINCPGFCSSFYEHGSVVTLTAAPSVGFTFTGWSGCDSAHANSCTVIMNISRSVSANFTATTYSVPLTVTVGGSGVGTVTSSDGQINCRPYCSGNYSGGSMVTLTATAGWASTFVSWTGCPSPPVGNVCTGIIYGPSATTATFSGSFSGLRFVPVPPCRVADTRNATGTFGAPSIAANTSRSFPIPQSACNIPSSALAYSLNFTVVPQGGLGYLTVWPSGSSQPFVSTLNSADGRVKANASIMPAGTNGAISVYPTDTTDLIIDIDGYFVLATDPIALAFYPVTPCRVVDTRNANGPLGGPFLGAQVGRAFPVLVSNCNLPSNAQAYSMNFTAVPRGPLGYLTVWPSDQTQPHVSTLNAYSGQVTANAAIVPAASNGDISAYADSDSDLVIDVDGYFAPAGSGGLSLYPVLPCRVLDTRSTSGLFSGELTASVAGSPCAVPLTAQAYVSNATVVPPGGLGYLSLWPDTETKPLVSTLNALDGAITSNMAIVPTVNGSVDAFASSLTQLILDISSYFAP